MTRPEILHTLRAIGAIPDAAPDAAGTGEEPPSRPASPVPLEKWGSREIAEYVRKGKE